MDKKKYLTVKEVMKITKLSRPIVYKYCKLGIFECEKAVKGSRSPYYILDLSVPAYLRKNNL